MEIRFEHAVVERPGFRLNVDMTIPGDGITAIVGPSGSGKSTLLNAIAGFEPLAEGELFLGGDPQSGVAPSDRPVSMVFQDNNLFPHLTVAQNVGLGLDPGLKLSAAQTAARDRVLAEVGLEDYGTRRPGSLSGGQRSRAALARALLRDRPVLLLDEPFAALGPGLRAEMMDLVSALQADRGMTVLMVTHDPRDAKRIAGQTVLVANHKAAPPVDTGALFANPPPALRVYLGL